MFFEVLVFPADSSQLAAEKPKAMEDTQEVKERTFCLRCGKKINGRTDKVFCSDQCRSLYHYQKSRTRTLVRTRVLGTLDRNYLLLDTLIEQGVTEIMVDNLEQMGFRRGCATGFTDRGRLKEYWCFDIRYFISNGRLHHLRRPLEILNMMP